MDPASTDDDHPVDPQLRIAELEIALADRDARITELEALLAKLVVQVAVLTEKLNRNSSNSNLPPSSDGPGSAAKKKADAKPDGPKRGGQQGHRGAHRELLPVERVDQFIDLFAARCGGCGSTLPETLDAAARRYQVLELLLGRPHLTEIRRNEVDCHCGVSTLAAFDPVRIPSSPFGPRLISVVALLTGVYHLSRRMTQRLLRELFAIEISLGAVSSIEARASEALAPAFEEAQAEVEAALVKYSDGTSWARAGFVMSLWVLASALATVYHVVENGCRETIRPLYGALIGILVSDRASVFGFWSMLFRQICWAHLLRKFVGFSERDGPAGRLGRELLDCAALVFEYWHGFKSGELTREELDFWMRPVKRNFEALLERAAAAGIRGLSGSCLDMLEHRQALWTFVTREGVEPTNNHAERELRGWVLWRRGCFGTQSERGERFAERLMTVAATARKQGTDVLDFIVRSVTAHLRGATLRPQLIAA